MHHTTTVSTAVVVRQQCTQQGAHGPTLNSSRAHGEESAQPTNMTASTHLQRLPSKLIGELFQLAERESLHVRRALHRIQQRLRGGAIVPLSSNLSVGISGYAAHGPPPPPHRPWRSILGRLYRQFRVARQRGEGAQGTRGHEERGSSCYQGSTAESKGCRPHHDTIAEAMSASTFVPPVYKVFAGKGIAPLRLVYYYETKLSAINGANTEAEHNQLQLSETSKVSTQTGNNSCWFNLKPAVTSEGRGRGRYVTLALQQALPTIMRCRNKKK